MKREEQANRNLTVVSPLPACELLGELHSRAPVFFHLNIEEF